jgi:uncharacterized SAM-binding protein YcdF (DUF218 family)
MSRGRVLAAAIALLLIAYLCAAPLLRSLGRFLVVDQVPERADAIVVLTGSFPDRILEAVDLFDGDFAPRIVLCREPENVGYRHLRERGVVMPRVFERNRIVAEQLGVPSEAITVLDRTGDSTFSEARAVLDYLAQIGATSMLLVTSKYHTRRAGAIYRHLAGDSMRVITRPARYGRFQPDAWWRDRRSLRRAVVEYQKLLLFHVHDRWNTEPG